MARRPTAAAAAASASATDRYDGSITQSTSVPSSIQTSAPSEGQSCPHHSPLLQYTNVVSSPHCASPSIDASHRRPLTIVPSSIRSVLVLSLLVPLVSLS